jgi:hypothetical protein
MDVGAALKTTVSLIHHSELQAGRLQKGGIGMARGVRDGATLE